MEIKNFDFIRPNISKKGNSCLKVEKFNLNIKFRIFEIVPNFRLNREIWVFEPNFPKKGIFGLKENETFYGLGNVPSVETCHDQYSQYFHGHIRQKEFGILKFLSPFAYFNVAETKKTDNITVQRC